MECGRIEPSYSIEQLVVEASPLASSTCFERYVIDLHLSMNPTAGDCGEKNLVSFNTNLVPYNEAILDSSLIAEQVRFTLSTYPFHSLR